MRFPIRKDDHLPLLALVVAVGSLSVEIWALVRAFDLLFSP
jgi:hypothetical protein